MFGQFVVHLDYMLSAPTARRHRCCGQCGAAPAWALLDTSRTIARHARPPTPWSGRSNDHKVSELTDARRSDGPPDRRRWNGFRAAEMAGQRSENGRIHRSALPHFRVTV
jgi:hypothetical protein